MKHEVAVQWDQPWKLGDRVITFKQDGQRVTAHISDDVADKPGTPAKTTTINKLPALMQVTAFGKPYGLTLRLADDGKSLRVASAFGLAVPLGTRRGYLVDSDMDGRIGSAGDGVIVPGSRTVGPMQSDTQFWTRARAAAVKPDGSGGWLVAQLVMPKPSVSDHGAAWRHWNWQRQLCGLLPLEYDERYEAGMRKHADYLLINKVYSHREDPRLPGYSREGAAAGMSCVIGFLKRSHLQAIQSQMLTLFHRTSCLAPELQAGAMVLRQGVFMANTKSRVGGPLRGVPLVYPPHGMTGVPCEFNIAGEAPMPTEGPGGNNRLGTCVAVRFASLYWARALPEPPELLLMAEAPDGSLEPVAGRLHYPGRAPRVRGLPSSYLGHVALVPTSFLKADTRYHAMVRMQVPVASSTRSKVRWTTFRYDWQFTTGHRRPRR